MNHIVLPIAAALTMAISATASAQQPWPQRPVRIVVGFPPGGVTGSAPGFNDLMGGRDQAGEYSGGLKWCVMPGCMKKK